MKNPTRGSKIKGLRPNSSERARNNEKKKIQVVFIDLFCSQIVCVSTMEFVNVSVRYGGTLCMLPHARFG